MTERELLQRRALLLRKKRLLLQKAQLQELPSLIPKSLSRMGKVIETWAEEAGTPVATAVGAAREGLMGVAGAVIPGGRMTVEKPEMAIRTALGILRPIPSLMGFGAKILARTPRGKELIEKTRERMTEITPVTIPGRIQKSFAEQTTPEEFQEFAETVAEAGAFLGVEVLGAKVPIIRKNIVDLGKSLSRFSLFKNPDFVLQQSDRINQLVDDAETQAGRVVKDLWAGKIGDKNVDKAKAGNTLKRLPKNVLRAMRDPEKTSLFNIRFERDGSLSRDARNIWNVRRFLDNFLTSKDFIDATKIEKQAILTARRGLAAILRDVDKMVAPIMERFSKITKAADRIRGVTTMKGEAVANKLQNLYTSKGEPGVRKFFTQMQEFVPEIENLTNEVIKFNRGQVLKRVAGRTLAIGIPLEILRRAVTRPAAEAVVGETIPTQAQ